MTRSESRLDRLIAWSAFPQAIDADREQAKANAARIAVGLIMLYRTALIVAATYYYHPTDVTEAQITAKFLLGCGMLVLLAIYTVGFCTPLAGLVLIAAYPYFDARLLTGTLGTNVASLCLIALLLLNTGGQYSIDGVILRSNGVIGSVWRGMYNVFGFPSATQATCIYFLFFAAYAVISFSALAYHVNDAFWREGHTVGVMLTDAYLSRYYEFFRAWEITTPTLYRAFSIICVAGQTIFQVAMLPLIFVLWGRRFVVAWGLIFFFISAVCLQLSYLPYLELVLWALIFARMGAKEPESTAEKVQRRSVVIAYTAAMAIAFIVFLATWFAPGGRAWSGNAWERPHRALAWIGLDAPQVFNDADLRMGGRWPVIHRIDANGDRTLVPLNGEDGQRLAYHRSDLLYFGNSLRWRRRMIASDPAVYNRRGKTGYEQIREVCYYDFARGRIRDSAKYEVRVYENRSARFGLPAEERYNAEQILAFDLEIGSALSLSGD